MFKCKKCDKEYKEEYWLKRHLKSCNGLLKCEFCDKKLINRQTRFCSRRCQGDYQREHPELWENWNKLGTEKVNKFWREDSEERRRLLEKINTPEHRKKLSETRKQKILSGEITPTTFFGSGSGFREDLNQTFRSRWEANFARIAKLNNQQYEYEVSRFKIVYPDNSYRTYTPDFKIEEKYYEIKGYWKPAALEKFNLF